MSPTTPTSKIILSDLNPFFPPRDEKRLEDIGEALAKLDAALSMLIGCCPEKGDELTISTNDIHWGLLIMSDLLDEVKARTEAFQNHVSITWDETERRLDQCKILEHHSTLTMCPRGASHEHR